MPAEGKSAQSLRFDDYEVDLRAGELYKAGQKIRLQVQPFHVLAILLERPGEVVTREELQKRLWPADTFVDFDHSLNTAVKKLRQALSDDKKKVRFVETLPKRGYRFVGKIEQFGTMAAPVKMATPSAWVGRVAKLGASEPGVTLLAVDEEAAAERHRLEAANDDVGLSLLIASQKLLLVTDGTQVRILELGENSSYCQVRILDGEHYGKTAMVYLSMLEELA